MSNTGFTFSESFNVKQHYCITKEGSGTRLKSFTAIDFISTPYLFKGTVQKGTYSGVETYCTSLKAALEVEAARVQKEKSKFTFLFPLKSVSFGSFVYEFLAYCRHTSSNGSRWPVFTSGTFNNCHSRTRECDSILRDA